MKHEIKLEEVIGILSQVECTWSDASNSFSSHHNLLSNKEDGVFF